MKINNKNTVRFLFRMYIVLCTGMIFSLAGFSIFFPEIFRNVKFVGIAFLIYCIVKILRFHYIEYENSGEVLSLKSYHIFDSKHEGKQVELPLEKVRKLYVKKTFWINYLIINIQKNDKKTIRIHFPIDHMKRRDLEMIESHFTNY